MTTEHKTKLWVKFIKSPNQIITNEIVLQLYDYDVTKLTRVCIDVESSVSLPKHHWVCVNTITNTNKTLLVPTLYVVKLYQSNKNTNKLRIEQCCADVDNILEFITTAATYLKLEEL